MPQSRLTDYISCPKCSAALSQGNGQLQCKQGHEFPVLDNIPALFEAPEARLGEWRGSMVNEIDKINLQIEQCEQSKPTLASSSRRLQKMSKALLCYKAELQEILSSVASFNEAPVTLNQKLAGSLPISQSLSAYITNLHRDWGWPKTAENEASLQECLSVLPKNTQIKSMLVLGAGAGRLAYDLHNQLSPELTVVADINPLLVMAGKSIISGKKIPLTEIPKTPLSEDNVAQTNQLQAPVPVTSGIEFILCDGSTNWFKPGSFDLVVTPWFIDIVAEPPTSLFKRINGMLKMQGLWINFGSIAWQSSDPQNCYSREEVLELCEKSGFTIENKTENKVPYLQSPYSAHGRIENTLTFAAKKKAKHPIPKPFHHLPEWLLDHTKPVPRTDALESAAIAHAIYVHVLSMVDGSNSIDDMASAMHQDLQMDLDQARQSLTSFLTSLAAEGRV